MPQKRPTAIKISYERLYELHCICSNMLQDFLPENRHETLLKAYMEELVHRIKNMTDKNQERYTLRMNGAEGIAFYQMWDLTGMTNDKHAKIVAGTLLQKLAIL